MSRTHVLPWYSGYVTECIFPGKKTQDSGRKYFRVRYGVLRVYPNESSNAAAFKVNLRTGEVDFDYETATIVWRLASHQKVEVNSKCQLSFTAESREEFNTWLRIINHCTNWALEETYSPSYTIQETYKWKEQVGETTRIHIGEEAAAPGNANIIIQKFYTVNTLEKNQVLRDHEVTFGYKHEHILESLDYLNDVDSVITIHERYYDDLKHVLSKCEGRKMKEKYAILIIKAVVSALVHMHTKRYTYHGDIRPENVKFARGNVIKLSGFYHADRTAKNGSISVMVLNPKAKYCWPPESGTKKWWTNKIDVWQVGTLLFECLSGKKAAQFSKFPSEAQRECPDFRRYFKRLEYAKLSGECRSFIESAMKYNPAKRASILDLENHPWLQHVSKQGHSMVLDTNNLRLWRY